MEPFWKTIALYNSAIWIMRFAIIVVLLTLRLAYRLGRLSTIGMKLYLIFLYLWIAFVYFYVCCAERSYQEIMTIFWCILSASWIWDLIKGYPDFKCDTKYRGLIQAFFISCCIVIKGINIPTKILPVSHVSPPNQSLNI